MMELVSLIKMQKYPNNFSTKLTENISADALTLQIETSPSNFSIGDWSYLTIAHIVDGIEQYNEIVKATKTASK